MGKITDYRRKKAAKYLNRKRIESNQFRDEARRLRKEIGPELPFLREWVKNHGKSTPTLSSPAVYQKAWRVGMLEFLVRRQRERARILARLLGGNRKRLKAKKT